MQNTDLTYILSNSIAGIFEHCPITLIDLVYKTVFQFEQFEGTALPQIVESFMFGMLANSIKFRDIFVKIQMEYSPTSNAALMANTTSYVTLVEQCARFMKGVVYFDNLYVNTTKTRIYISRLSNLKQNSLVPFNQSETLDRLFTTAFSGVLTRYTDFYQ